jgi:hypothetical protein
VLVDAIVSAELLPLQMGTAERQKQNGGWRTCVMLAGRHLQQGGTVLLETWYQDLGLMEKLEVPEGWESPPERGVDGEGSRPR